MRALLELERLQAFQELVNTRGQDLYRSLPWRDTVDPYEVLVSEVMLQQTQVSRVLKHWDAWVERFPTVDALAAAPLETVLGAWQGMGYNRRAVALKNAASQISSSYAGVVPREKEQLLALPGVGPSTAAGVRIFAYGVPDVYLETNVRTVFLHELFASEFEVPDSVIIPLIEQSCNRDDPRTWYYALLDYGAYLKQVLPNPSRRSKHYNRQSKFEGSRRQKRAWLLKETIAAGFASTDTLAEGLSCTEIEAGREPVPYELVESILKDLESERFLVCEDDIWRIA